MHIKLIYIGILYSLLVTSCAQLSKHQTTHLLSGTEQEKHLEKLNLWQAEGKIALRSPATKQSANLTWQQQTESFTIKLSGPLGQGGGIVRGNQQGVSLQITGEAPIYSNSIEQLIQNELSWNIPIHALKFWLKGLPAPDLQIEQIQKNKFGLEQLKQAGWHINYLAYQPALSTWLPRKIVLKQKQTEIKIIIHNWRRQGL